MFQRPRPRGPRIIRADNEFRKGAYPFLDTRTPTDSLPNPLGNSGLSDVEKRVLIEKRRWLATIYPDKLASLVARIIEDRKESPITAAVVLGLSGEYSGLDTDDVPTDRDCEQFVAFSQILAQMGSAVPGLLNNIFAQDPGMTPEWRALLENHGIIVVEHPAALDRLGPNTVLFCPFVQSRILNTILEDRPISELAMFVGNGCDMKDGAAKGVVERMCSYFFEMN